MPPDFGWPSPELRNAAPGKESGALCKDGNNNSASFIVPPRGDQDFRHCGAQVVDLGEQRFARDVDRVHQRGAAFLHRLLADWGAQRLLRTALETLFRRAARLNPADIAAVGGDRWAP